MITTTGPKISSRAIAHVVVAGEDRRPHVVAAVEPLGRLGAAGQQRARPRRSRSGCSRARARAAPRSSTGPSVVAGSKGSPITKLSALATASVLGLRQPVARARGCGSARRRPARRCARRPRCRRRWRARSRRPARMMLADLPPSSRCTRLTSRRASSITRRPARTEPVSDTMSTSGCGDDRLADLRPGAGDQVEDARRQAGLVGDLGEDVGRERRDLAAASAPRCSRRRSPRPPWR